MKEFDQLIDLLKVLRSPEGCPWDRKQTKESLLPYLIEEVHEFMETVDDNDPAEGAKELGDLFLHLVFQGVIAEEKGQYRIADSLSGIREKLIRRHPHVFSDTETGTEEELNVRWEQQKMKEGRKKVLDGIPATLPTLHKSYRIQEKAAAAGFDWLEIDGVYNKIHEELDELQEALEEKDKAHQIEEMGDLIFSMINLCRWLQINPDEALRKANNKFIQRFNAVENALQRSGRTFSDHSLDELESIWQQEKMKLKNTQNI